MTKMWRHGDVLVRSIKEIPSEATKRQGSILARGEATGHAHRIQGKCELFESKGTLYLQILDDEVELVHEEHKTIVLPKGKYRVWQQREYSPTEIRRVMD